MKIMIVGIGGVGGYIAGMVGQKYKNLTLIARGKRGEALREHGVVLHSDFHGEKIVKDGVIRECAREVEEIQDLIFLCVKTYALEDVCQTLGSCVDDHTIIVPVMNGADTAQRVREYLGSTPEFYWELCGKRNIKRRKFQPVFWEKQGLNTRYHRM